MKTLNLLTPGQALAQALIEAAESCRAVRSEVLTVKSSSRTKKSKSLERLARSARRLDAQLSAAAQLLEKVVPGVQVAMPKSPAARRRADEVAGAAIDRELAIANSLAEEASGDTPAARSAARLLREREDGIHRRIDRHAARRSGSVRAKARRAHAAVEIAVNDSESRQEEHARQQRVG